MRKRIAKQSILSSGEKRKSEIKRIANKQIKNTFFSRNHFSKLLIGCSEFDTSWLVYGWKKQKNDFVFYFWGTGASRRNIKLCKQIASSLNRKAFFYFYFPDRGGGFEELIIFGLKVIIKKGMESFANYIIDECLKKRNVHKVIDYQISENEDGILVDIKDDSNHCNQFLFEYSKEDNAKIRLFREQLVSHINSKKKELDIYDNNGKIIHTRGNQIDYLV
jgi:hypothetical protein